MSVTFRRPTRQRAAVEALLVNIGDFMSAQDLHARLRAQGQGVGLATVYRTLQAMAAEGAARARHGALPEKTVQAIRAHAAAAENVGNFFGEDIFIAVGAVLLMKGFFDAEGMNVGVWSMALWGIPTALVAFAVLWWRCRRLDRRVAREAATGPERQDRS